MSRKRIGGTLYKVSLILFLIAFIFLPLHQHNHKDPYFHSDCGACILSIDFAALITNTFIVFVLIFIHLLNQMVHIVSVPTRFFITNGKRAPPVISSL